MRATYRLRDVLKNCRSVYILPQEFPEWYKNTDRKTSAQEEANAYVYIYMNRWAPVISAIQEFDSNTLEAELLWGKEVRNRTDRLRHCVTELNVAIQATISDKFNEGKDFETDKELGKQTRSIVSGRQDEKDELSKKIMDAINAIDEQIRPHLQRS